MAYKNCTRTGCKDVFRSFLVKNATFAGTLEIPCIQAEQTFPARLIPFSKAVGGMDFDCWVHFYEDDVAFERLWNHPNKYLPILKRYKGIISPDFSIYRDMPLVMQQWNIYRGRALACWLQENGVPVIANVRWGDERTFDLCCTGVPTGAVIAIGSHGCVKVRRDRDFFKRGLEHIINVLHPAAIIVYGTTPDAIFDCCKIAGIDIIHFDSDYNIAHQKAVSA